MKAALVYRSRYGTTERCAREIASGIHCDADLFDLRRKPVPILNEYGLVIIGGPIYAGKGMVAIRRFCDAHREELLQRDVGLFICCLYDGEKAEEELARSYPEWLAAHAYARTWLGGAIEIGKLKPIDRFLTRKVGGAQADVDTVDAERIRAFCAATNARVRELAT